MTRPLGCIIIVAIAISVLEYIHWVVFAPNELRKFETLKQITKIFPPTKKPNKIYVPKCHFSLNNFYKVFKIFKNKRLFYPPPPHILKKATTMYSAQRTELERSGQRMKAKRGNLHFTEAGELCLKPGSARPLSAEEVSQHIAKYRREFPRAVIDLEGYTAIDQGDEGACSFVGFLNLACLTGNVVKLRKNTFATWKRIWASFRIAVSEDIASTLDKLVAQKIVSPDAIVYIPIRSSGAGENMYNVAFWRPGLTMKRFGLQLSAYKEAPFVYEVGNLIESAIDTGVPIEVNALCHSRVCVAYNDTNLLFADNWTHAYTETTSGMGNLVDFDVYAAGFSVVSKWAVYSAARDVVSFRVD